MHPNTAVDVGLLAERVRRRYAEERAASSPARGFPLAAR